MVIINTKYLLMYLTVLSHFNMRQVNTLGDICNENILLMSKSNIRTETFLIVIRNFGDHHICIFDMWREIIVNPYS